MENFKAKAKLFKKIATVSAKADIKKDKKVDFTAKGRRVKYSYASYPAIKKAINPLLLENGLAVSHSTTVQDNNTYLLTTYVVDVESGEYVSSEKIYHINANQQTNGSNETYCKRYNTVLLLDLDADDDDDANLQQVVSQAPQPQRAVPQRVAPQRVEVLKGLLKGLADLGVTDEEDKIKQFFNIANISNLTVKEAEEVIQALTNRVAQLKGDKNA